MGLNKILDLYYNTGTKKIQIKIWMLWAMRFASFIVQLWNILSVVLLIYFSVIGTSITVFKDKDKNYKTVCMLNYKGQECEGCCATHYALISVMCAMIIIGLISNTICKFSFIWKKEARHALVRKMMICTSALGCVVSISYLIIFKKFVSGTCEYIEKKENLVCLTAVAMSDRGRDLVLLTLDAQVYLLGSLIAMFILQLVLLYLAIFIENRIKNA